MHICIFRCGCPEEMVLLPACSTSFLHQYCAFLCPRETFFSGIWYFLYACKRRLNFSQLTLDSTRNRSPLAFWRYIQLLFHHKASKNSALRRRSLTAGFLCLIC